MRVYFVISLFLFANTGLSQHHPGFKNQFGIVPFVIEVNSVASNQGVKPKFLAGIYYTTQFNERWGWNSQIEYGENTLNNNPIGYKYFINGKGTLSEMNILSGFQFILNPNRLSGFRWFLETDVFFSRLNYFGVFSEGFTGVNYLWDRTYYMAGGRFGMGFSVIVKSRIVLTSFTSFQIGSGFEKNNIVYNRSDYIGGALTFSKLSIGYRF